MGGKGSGNRISAGWNSISRSLVVEGGGTGGAAALGSIAGVLGVSSVEMEARTKRLNDQRAVEAPECEI